PSISRAILMTILSCLGFFVFRQVDLINILFIIASIMVLQNPYIIYNISFELSFLAMLSLAIFTKYIKQYVYSDILAGSISVAIFTSPLVLYKFETVSTMGVLGNLVILPMMALIICLDMLSIITYYINIPIYSILAYINSSIIDLVMVLLKRIGDYGVNNIDVRDPSLFKLLTYYIIVVGLAIYLDYYYIEKGKYTRELYLVKEEVVEHI
ncbi:ComEC/Rec2 family competence protein, partial [Peptostreptococcus anaerobius]